MRRLAVGIVLPSVGAAAIASACAGVEALEAAAAALEVAEEAADVEGDEPGPPVSTVTPTAPTAYSDGGAEASGMPVCSSPSPNRTYPRGSGRRS
jgi:hypothetical protein